MLVAKIFLRKSVLKSLFLMMCFYVCNFFYYVLPARMSVPTCRGQKKVPHPWNSSFMCVCSCSCPQKGEVSDPLKLQGAGSCLVWKLRIQLRSSLLSTPEPSPQPSFLFFNKVGSHYIALYSSRVALNLRSSCLSLSRYEPGKVLFKQFQAQDRDDGQCSIWKVTK